MTELNIFDPTVDVVGEVIREEVAVTVAKLRELCGTEVLTEVALASDHLVAVYHPEASLPPDEVFVVTNRVEDAHERLEEKFAIQVSPPKLIGHSHQERSELDRINDRLIDLHLGEGDGTEIATLEATRAQLRAEAEPDFVPQNEIEDISMLGFARMLASLAHEAKIARMTQEAEAYHSQKKTA